MAKNNIKINKKKIVELCQIVYNSWKNKEKVFARENIEEEMFPENQLISLLDNKNDVDKALWTFFSVLGDRKTSSKLLYKQFAEFYKVTPNFFDRNILIERINELSVRLVTQVVKYKGEIVVRPKIQINYPSQFVDFALSNTKKLISEYNCSILDALPNDDFDDCFKRLQKFKGYGIGLSSLFLVFLKRYGIKKIKGHGVPKIDRHFVRISASCGAFDVGKDKRYDLAAKNLTKVYYDVCKEYGFDACELDPLVWVIGSELCNKNDGKYCRKYCPLEEKCNRNLPSITNDDTILIDKVKSKKQIYFNFD